jgi:hypothetical protein
MVTTTKTATANRKMGAESWRLVRDDLTAKLTGDDDPALWEFALTTILGRTRADASLYTGKEAIIVQIGCCSHWIRPKWKSESGMTWPFGYAPTVFHWGTRGARVFKSNPAFDWSFKWLLDPASGSLEPMRGQPTRRPLCHRICLPARTARHPQATVHTIWTPGSPENPKRKWLLLYGFERTERGWRCFAEWEGDRQGQIYKA